ncbi:hypothetical protein Tco_0307183 [Tanacetum coccineum]
MVKNKGLVAEAYEWDEEDVSSDDNEMVEVKVLMALVDDENFDVSKESARNGKWVKISIRKHVNTEILKENQNLRKLLKELTEITESWLNSFIKVNQGINEQIQTQKKRILGLDQLIEEPSSSGQTNLVFVKSSVDDTNVSTPAVERPWLSEAAGFMLPNHDTGIIIPSESQVKVTDPSVIATDFSVTSYDSADESSVCNTPLPPLEKSWEENSCRRALGKITNCDVLSRGKGLITLKVYRDDGSDETIPNFKASDMHLSEWREVMQDPIIKLNDLARKKRKHVDDIHDYFKSTKRQDFVTIEEFRDFTNEMLYTVQEIFFRLHQGPGQDDHARTFSSFLLEEIVGSGPKPFSLLIDLNIKYPKYKLAEDKFNFSQLKTSSASVLQVLRRSSNIFTSVYLVVQKLKKALARASVQLGWQFQAKRCRSPLRS